MAGQIVRQVDVRKSNMLKGPERSIFNGRYKPKPQIPKPYPNGNFWNITVPTLDIRNIDVTKVDIVEVDLAEQSIFCKST